MHNAHNSRGLSAIYLVNVMFKAWILRDINIPLFSRNINALFCEN